MSEFGPLSQRVGSAVGNADAALEAISDDLVRNRPNHADGLLATGSES